MHQGAPGNRRVRIGRLAATLVLVLPLGACALRGAVPEPPVPERASALLAEAREHLRVAGPWSPGEPQDPAELAAARRAAEQARDLAPGWAAPWRLLDDLAREGLDGPEALAAHLARLAETPRDPLHAYLAGRLEGTLGGPLHRRAHAADPSFAWAVHALAWLRSVQGDARGALAAEEDAIALAREPWERSFFVRTQARFLLAARRAEDAAKLLAAELARAPLRGGDRVELEATLASAELSCEDPARLETGHRRALRLIRTEDVPRAELRPLADALMLGSARRGRAEVLNELEAALAARPGAGRPELLAELMYDRGARDLALSLWRGEEGAARELAPTDARLRATRLSVGDVRPAIEDWLAGQPAVVLAADGLPREPSLREVVLAARAGDGAAALTRLGERLLEAGWFAEARGLSSWLARLDPDAALSLAGRAARGLVLFQSLRDLMARVDAHRPFWSGLPGEAPAPGGTPAPAGPVRITSLDALLRATSTVLQRWLPPDAPPLDLVDSPRLAYGPFATVVHPGPSFSAADERAGRGRAGDPVGGVAAAFAALGRFALFGQVLGGGGPDATVLRRLAVEHRAGEHLGVPFEGTVVWCDGADVPSRPARHGARITGAALHEGYWVDVDGEREDLARWSWLEARLRAGLFAPDALASRGPRLPAAGLEGGRLALAPLLGEGDRVRLAVLRDRLVARADAPGDGGPLVSLDEVLALTALHEEGHLCDRTRFLPLSTHLPGALGFLLDAGLFGEGIAQRLEYRAQLTALCEAPDPRMVLADCLDDMEAASTVTAHPAAYHRLVRDLLRRLDAELPSHPDLRPDHPLVLQLHRLAPEELRALTLEVARDEGLLAPGWSPGNAP